MLNIILIKALLKLSKTVSVFLEEPTVENIQEALCTFLSGKIRFDQNECRAFAKRFTWHKVVNQALPYYWN